MCALSMRDDVSTLIFDLDGTLANTLPDIASAVRYALGAAGCVLPSDDTVKACIGGGAKNLIRRALGEEHAGLFDETLSVFSAYYNEHVVVETKLYPDVTDILEHYSGKKRIALATFKSRQGTMKILEHYGILKYFDAVVTVDDVEKPKPDPECILRLLDGFSASPEEAVYVGDTITDIRTGKNAGVVTCAVSYGFGSMEEISSQNPNYIIDSLSKLTTIF